MDDELEACDGPVGRPIRTNWLTLIGHFMATVLLALSAVMLIEWLAVITVSGLQWIRYDRWPHEALPYWFHILLPVSTLTTWRLGRWVAGR